LGAEIGRQAIQHPLEDVELALNVGAGRLCAEAEVVG
jgi:hypothetical protein